MFMNISDLYLRKVDLYFEYHKEELNLDCNFINLNISLIEIGIIKPKTVFRLMMCINYDEIGEGSPNLIIEKKKITLFVPERSKVMTGNHFKFKSTTKLFTFCRMFSYGIKSSLKY